MNLVMNSTTFGGKQEVVYALKNAAREAKTAELLRSSAVGPRPINKAELVKERKEVLQAYMDMAVYDDCFEKAIEQLPFQEEGNLIKAMLKPQKVQWGEINPVHLFESSMTVNCMTQKKRISPDILNSFLKFLKN